MDHLHQCFQCYRNQNKKLFFKPNILVQSWQRPFRICTALLMGDRPTGTQSWRLSQSELVIQHHSPPISVSLSYYLLLTLYSRSRNTSKQLAVLKSLSFPPQASVSLSETPIHSTSQTCCREAILPFCLSPTQPPAVSHQTLPADFSFSSYSTPSPLYHRRPPSSEPLLQALRDGCTGLARKCIQVLTSPRRRAGSQGNKPERILPLPLPGPVSPWTFHLARLIICKKYLS